MRILRYKIEKGLRAVFVHCSDTVVEALVWIGAMEYVVEQGVGDVADDLLSATLFEDVRGLGLNHGYGEEEEGIAKLGENHPSSCWRWLSLL